MKKSIISTLAGRMLIAATMLAGAASWAQDIQVIHPTNTVWIYNDSSISTDNPTLALGTSPRWMDPTYVPVIGNGQNQWKAGGRGLFGNDTSTVYTNLFGTFGNGFRTPVNRDIPGVGTSARITFYFITKFNWPYTPNNVVLRGTNWLDDGGIVYLNGVEVFRARQPGTPGVIPTWDAVADNQGAEGVPEPLEYAAISLVTGENTLAVEVHQTSTTSSDLAFTTALRAVLPATPTNTTPTEPSDRAVIQNRPTTLAIVGDGNPRPAYQWYHDEVAIPDATNASYAIAFMQSTDAGQYKVRLFNEFGAATSRVAQVTYVADTVNPLATEAVGSASFTEVVINYNEVMDTASAGETFNYTITDPSMNVYPVEKVVLSPDGRAVILSHPSAGAHPQGTVLTVSIQDVLDKAQNMIDPTNVTLTSWVTNGCNGVVFETYSPLDTADNNIATSLLASPMYPNKPADTRVISAFDSRLVYADNSKEGYGARLRGIFIPQFTGSYIFYLGSDDSSRVYMNPNGPAETGKVLIVEETGCCNLWPDRASAPQALIAGQGYYIEAIYKEGTGGDYGKVAARLQSEGPPLDDPETVIVSTNSIGGNLAGYLAAPPNIAGPLTLLQQPKSVTNEATQPVTLDATASNISGIICYQWQRSENNGPFTDVPGAIRPIYSIPFPTVADDNGDTYRCLVRAPGSSVMSAEATLTISADVTRPRVTRVVATSASSLAVYFSEPLAPGSGDAFNFAINPGGSGPGGDGVVNPANPLRMDLPITPDLTLGATYNLVAGGAEGITDTSGNILSPDPTTVSFRAQVYTNNPDALVTLPTNNVLPIGALTQRGILGRIVQVPGNDVANTNYIREQMLAGVYPDAANPMAATVFGGSFIETNAINYDRTAATNTAPFGHIAPDVQFPGFPLLESTPDSFYNNMTMEAVAYVQLQKGIVRMGVNSDDGFTVTPALSITDPAATNILGQFEGGRGATDSVFDFYVDQDGLYPFRLMWEQGGGGANVEWWVISDDNTLYQPINSATNGPPAFVPPCSDKAIASQLVGNNLVVQWPDAGLGHLFVLQQSGALGSPTVWSNAVNIPQLIGGNRTATIPLQPGENRIFRLHKAGPPCP